MNQDAQEMTFEESMREVMQTLPPVIRNYLAQGKYTPVAQNLAAKYGLRVDQAGVLEREIMLLLMGVEDPTEFATSLRDDASLDQLTIEKISHDVNEHIFLPLRKEEEEQKTSTSKSVVEQAPAPAPAPVASLRPEPIVVRPSVVSSNVTLPPKNVLPLVQKPVMGIGSRVVQESIAPASVTTPTPAINHAPLEKPIAPVSSVPLPPITPIAAVPIMPARPASPVFPSSEPVSAVPLRPIVAETAPTPPSYAADPYREPIEGSAEK